MTGPNPGDRAVGEALTDRIVRLGRALHAAGVPVAGGHLVDAAEAVRQMDLGEREQIRIALRATLVTTADAEAVFERLFDRIFPLGAGAPAIGGTPAALDSDLIGLVARATPAALADVAAALVDQYGGMDDGLRSERYHVRRVLRGADLARLLSQAMAIDPDDRPDAVAFRDQVARLRELVGIEVRRRLPLEPDTDLDGIEDIDILRASRHELERMRAVVRPLARRLAARLVRRQRSPSGRVDVRRTIRRSLASGGVPVDVSYRKRRPHRPELLVLADISGSVADFATFTLTFVTAVSEELATTRSFAFVDAVDEITTLLRGTDHTIEPWQLLRNASVIGDEGHSDYGRVLEQFWATWGEAAVRPTTTVIVTGDARTNHRPPGLQHFARLAERAREVYWLNPEPRDEWDTGDSVMSQYAEHCRAVHEVRTLGQLAVCVEDIL